MFKGIYNGAAALNVLAQRQELISHNLANLNTSGFRTAQIAVDQRDSPKAQIFSSDLGPKVAERTIDFTPGRHERTNRALDVAIFGDAFFALDSPSGTVYSRGGQFYRDAKSGNLVNENGFPVQGVSGPIQIPQSAHDSRLVIDSDGTISEGENSIGQLLLVSFEDNNSLVPLTQSIFEAGQNSVITESHAGVQQFHQELSNGHPVSQLVAMITGMRQYDAVQKMSTKMSETLREHIRA